MKKPTPLVHRYPNIPANILKLREAVDSRSITGRTFIIDPQRFLTDLTNIRGAVVMELYWKFPPPGHGEKRLAVAVWQPDFDGDGCWWYGATSNFCGGFDKITAALVGCPVFAAPLLPDGSPVTLGDHCDYKQRPRLPYVCRQMGWVMLGESVG